MTEPNKLPLVKAVVECDDCLERFANVYYDVPGERVRLALCTECLTIRQTEEDATHGHTER